MLAKELLSTRLFPLKKTDTCAKALELLNELNVAYLPVVDDDIPLGLISASSLIDVEKPNKTIIESLIQKDIPYQIDQNLHLFEIVRIFTESPATVITVVSEDLHYKGIISAKELISNLAALSSFGESGSILTLELEQRDYSLAEISRLVEYNNAKILSLYISKPKEDSGLIHLHLKLNITNIQALIATFERYGYQIIGSYFREDEDLSLKDRYDALMKYLNL